MLCFVSFGIGLDLGIVLAKGVIFSLLCVFTILQTLILMCDKILLKTEKKRNRKNISVKQETSKQRSETFGAGVPVLADTSAQATATKKRRTFSDFMAGFEFKSRYAIMGIFIVVFVLACFFQSYTPTNFAMNNDDTIAEIFPTENPIVIVYNNDSSEQVNAIADTYIGNEYVSSVSSYENTLGKPYTSNEITQIIGAMGSDFTIDNSLINVIYYDNFDGTIYPVKAGTFFGLIYTLAQNESFSALIPAEMQEQIEMLNKFSNKESLTTPLSAEVLALSFDMDVNQIKMLLQAGQKGDSASVNDFINIAAEMAKNPQAGIDETTAAQLV